VRRGRLAKYTSLEAAKESIREGVDVDLAAAIS
jgi:hypothetical protein